MVVGNGMVAKAFSAFKPDNNIIIFASGVSNSSEEDNNEYEREIILLEKSINSKEKLIYFSTISVYDPSLSNTKYITHKKKIECLIKSREKNFIIFRLPILLGKTENKHTLTNFLFNKIINNEEILVYKNACRYLLDIDDVVKTLTPAIHANQFDNQIINVNINNQIKINELLNIFSRITNKEIKIKYIDKGGCYQPDNMSYINYLNEINYSFPDNYNEKIIQKYYSL
jgi:nucleoside-diphosphate-sugar epimerase